MKKLLKTLCLIALTVKVVAQPGTIDTTFNPLDVGYAIGDGFGWNDEAYSIIIQSDEKIIVGGYLNEYNKLSCHNIIRLNPDGSKDTNYQTGTGFDSEVRGIVSQPDEKILVYGNFHSYNGFSCNRFIRLNTDGTRDTSFNIGSGFEGYVYCMAIQPDGKIIIGGSITSYNGSDCYGIVRLHTDGILDTSFNVGTGVDGWISSITIQPDGKILPGGGFSSYNGSTCNNIVRLDTDGIIDTSFNFGNGFNSTVRSLISQSDGKIIVGGGFTSYNDTLCDEVVRLNTNGTIDASFNNGTGFNSTVYGIKIQSDGKIYIFGDFLTYNGFSCKGFIRLNIDGTRDTSFNIGSGFEGWMNCLAIQPDGKIVSVGRFYSFDGTACNSIARLNTDGIIDTNFNYSTGFNGDVKCLIIQPDGKMILGGTFTSYNGVRCGPVVRLNTDGSRDTTFNTANYFYVNYAEINVLALQSNGKIIIGGDFITNGCSSCNNIARLNSDGSLDPSFNTGGGGIYGIVYSLAIQTDGKILAGGGFDSYSWNDCYNIVRINSNGVYDSTFATGIGFNNYVKKISIQPDGKIIIGGLFSTYNGSNCNGIVRINTDGSRDNSFNIGSGFSTHVVSLDILPSGKVMVWGSFSYYNGTISKHIVCLNSDGSKDNSFNTGSGFYYQGGTVPWSLAVQPDSMIIVTGLFTSYNGTPWNHIIRLKPDGSVDPNFILGTGFGIIDCPNNCYEAVPALQIHPNGKLIACGNFVSYNGTGRNRIARIHTTCQSFITPEITIEISHPSNPVCEGETVTFEATTINEGAAPGYQWKVNGINAGTNSPIFVIPTLENGDVVTCEMTTIETCVTEDTVTSNSITMTITPVPQTPTISLAGNVLSSNAPTGNQWYDQNGIIIGASSQQYSVSVNGDYYNIVTVAGCSSDTSNIINITGIGVETIGSSEELSVYPNPTTNELIIEFEGNPTEISFELANTFGQIVLEGRLVEKAIICTQELAPGVYMLILKNDKEIDRIKVIKN